MQTTFSLLILSFLLTFSALGDNLLFNTKTKEFSDYTSALSQLPSQMHLVLGEYHYSETIQKAQSEMIKNVVSINDKAGKFTVGWEFLDYTNQEKIKNAFLEYKNDELSDDNFLRALFGENSNPADNATYLHIMKETKNLNGDFIGLNLPRSLKKLITTNGLEALDPQYVPANFELGGANYYERFAETMGGHVTEAQMKNYYAAQCITDSVMAEQLQKESLYDLTFTIVGSFHTDYNDGYVAQLKRTADLPIVTVKFIDTTELTQEEIDSFKIDDPLYGPIADFIFFLNVKE